jgi:gamma-glutamyltranspeptidase / glutathione hydrolase
VTNKYNDFRVTMHGIAPGEVSTAVGRGLVASASRQASELAIEVLQDGGNAFDAAFATAFSLCIYQPQAGNLGGGGYLLFQEKGGRPKAFNYREQAPMGASREAFLLPDGSPDPDRTAFGPASVCVPGTVKAFFELQERHGNLRARDLLLAVARRAREGAVLTQYEADCLNRLGPKLAASPEARRIYVRVEPFRAGDLLPNPALAETLTLLAREGERAFYRGRIAELMVADLQAHGGFLAAEDLADYALREVDPIHVDLAGRQVWTVPPEGGGALLLEILSILDREEFRRLAFDSPEYHHHVAQASKLAFIDRMAYLGDVPPGPAYRRLLTRENADRLFALIDPARDTPTEALAGRGGQPRAPGKNTTHFAILDAEGNAVSNSYTMNLRYGSKWAVARAGFLLNGSIDSFSFVEGKENYFGVVGSGPNLFAPGKRPASNMAPVLVTSGGAVEMLLGTPGGPTIPTTLANVLLASLHHGVPPETSIRAGRLHHQGWPDVLSHESGFDRPELLSALAGMGYALKDKQELISDVQGIFRRGEGYVAVSDYRREGQALACGA